VRLRIPNIEITRHPAPNAAEDLADKKSSVTDPYRDNDLLLDDHHRSPVDSSLSNRHQLLLLGELSFLDRPLDRKSLGQARSDGVKLSLK
jgi:hypothetical protein